jgi:GT2 family glycosyltransferase
MPHLLHEEYLLRIPHNGEQLRNELDQRVSEVSQATWGLRDPNVSIVVRSKNNAAQFEVLLDDITRQDFTGEVEVVQVDSKSTDGTAEMGKRFGTTIISISDRDDTFSYPYSLNRGFEAAAHPWVYTFVDHSALTNDQIFRIATRSEAAGNVGGVSSIVFPNANATLTERAQLAFGFNNRTSHPAHACETAAPGSLASNASLINREAWRERGGFDERFGAGGEDTALAAQILAAGHTIIVDPAMSVYHSHRLGPLGILFERHYWKTLHTPRPFDRKKLSRHRPEFRTPKHV